MRSVVIEKVYFTMEVIGGGYARGTAEMEYQYEDDGELLYIIGGGPTLATRCHEADAIYRANRVQNK